MKDGFPCKDCITLAICRHKGTHTGGVSALAMKCAIIDSWLTEEGERDWDLENMYDAYEFFKRRWML